MWPVHMHRLIRHTQTWKTIHFLQCMCCVYKNNSITSHGKWLIRTELYVLSNSSVEWYEWVFSITYFLPLAVCLLLLFRVVFRFSCVCVWLDSTSSQMARNTFPNKFHVYATVSSSKYACRHHSNWSDPRNVKQRRIENVCCNGWALSEREKTLTNTQRTYTH